jgi:hypothetical protein
MNIIVLYSLVLKSTNIFSTEKHMGHVAAVRGGAGRGQLLSVFVSDV